MLTLALETATRPGSVATCDEARCAGRAGDASRTHGERLPGDVCEWLAAERRTLADVDLFAVVSGPGSFTGLRVGMAAIQGLALAGGRKVVPVPTLDAMIAAALRTTTARGLLVPCLDGQRGEVFASVVEAGQGASSPDDCVRLLEPVSARPDEICERLLRDFGGRALVVIGLDLDRHLDAFRRALPAARLLAMPGTLAEAAARIAQAHPERAVLPHALRPLYVRRPDAVIARERAANARGPSPFVIRRATGSDDLSAVAALQRQTFTNPWGAESIRWELENTDVSRLYMMHDATGTLVGYCACWMVFDELHINSLAVDVERRRAGLATRLLRHVLAEASADGARSATLEVRRSNTAARGLYEGLGFQVEGIRRDYYQDPREDAVILWKRGLAGNRAAEEREIGRGEGQRAEGRGQRDEGEEGERK
jgi:tRNA threonylcarbamoyl adenosine modification protein YeaZ/ribosomal-protein-alanine acetyltransferase